MTSAQRMPRFESDSVIERRSRTDDSILAELIKVLAPHPGGLRRWSVMRAIRTDRERASLDIPQKLEDDVERVFRRHCADYGDSKSRPCSPEKALFHRPREKAGEV